MEYANRRFALRPMRLRPGSELQLPAARRLRYIIEQAHSPIAPSRQAITPPSSLSRRSEGAKYQRFGQTMAAARRNVRNIAKSSVTAGDKASAKFR